MEHIVKGSKSEINVCLKELLNGCCVIIDCRGAFNWLLRIAICYGIYTHPLSLPLFILTPVFICFCLRFTNIPTSGHFFSRNANYFHDVRTVHTRTRAHSITSLPLLHHFLLHVTLSMNFRSPIAPMISD